MFQRGCGKVCQWLSMVSNSVGFLLFFFFLQPQKVWRPWRGSCGKQQSTGQLFSDFSGFRITPGLFKHRLSYSVDLRYHPSICTSTIIQSMLMVHDLHFEKHWPQIEAELKTHGIRVKSISSGAEIRVRFAFPDCIKYGILAVVYPPLNNISPTGSPPR